MKIHEIAPFVNVQEEVLVYVAKVYHDLQAPQGKVHLEVLDATYICDSSCADNYLEIKHGIMLEQTGFRFTSNPLPKPPPAQWKGYGGITGLIGAENGIDNTWERVVLKELPRTLQTFGRPSKNLFSDISRILQMFFNQR
uniref:ADH_N_2 domain-containing protein n=1 Tax=Loa loa TaxID=7209 RepID=A0A1I7VJ96_LOALO